MILNFDRYYIYKNSLKKIMLILLNKICLLMCWQCKSTINQQNIVT